MSISLIASENESTVEFLLKALQADENAHARCVEFAAQADGERLHGIASLFRASARAKQIHADNHAHVIRQLGGNANRQSHAPEVGSTVENLRSELAYEDRAIAFYAGEIAASVGGESAARSLHWALQASKPRARLFREAITLLEAGQRDSWIGTARVFYVRQACGSLSEVHESDLCWDCDLLCSTLEKVG